MEYPTYLDRILQAQKEGKVGQAGKVAHAIILHDGGCPASRAVPGRHTPYCTCTPDIYLCPTEEVTSDCLRLD